MPSFKYTSSANGNLLETKFHSLGLVPLTRSPSPPSIDPEGPGWVPTPAWLSTSALLLNSMLTFTPMHLHYQVIYERRKDLRKVPTPPYASMCEHEPWLEVEVFTFPIYCFSFVSRPSNERCTKETLNQLLFFFLIYPTVF